MSRLVECSERIVAETIQHLKVGGGDGCETVVLWLGKDSTLQVREVYRPEQRVAIDYFHLPSGAVRQMVGHLRSTRQRIIAQVHSHPGSAYHSSADDEWSIVRHEGALYLVVPRFSADTVVGNFKDNTAVYRLDSRDAWVKVTFSDVICIGALDGCV